MCELMGELKIEGQIGEAMHCISNNQHRLNLILDLTTFMFLATILKIPIVKFHTLKSSTVLLKATIRKDGLLVSY